MKRFLVEILIYNFNPHGYSLDYDSAEVERRKLESMRLAEERRRLTLEAEERQFEVV